MRYVSIDIETTGLNPENCQILEIGAVIEDWISPILSLPHFHCLVKHDHYCGQAQALAMHGAIFELLTDDEPQLMVLRPKDVYSHFSHWLAQNDLTGTVTPAGKNFAGFDKQFLYRLPGFKHRFSQRTIDPAMLYWNPETDDKLPDTKTCLERADLSTEILHVALDDAECVIKLVRKYYGISC